MTSMASVGSWPHAPPASAIATRTPTRTRTRAWYQVHAVRSEPPLGVLPRVLALRARLGPAVLGAAPLRGGIARYPPAGDGRPTHRADDRAHDRGDAGPDRAARVRRPGARRGRRADRAGRAPDHRRRPRRLRSR